MWRMIRGGGRELSLLVLGEWIGSCGRRDEGGEHMDGEMEGGTETRRAEWLQKRRNDEDDHEHEHDTEDQDDTSFS